jgi:hypothetical protein
MFLYLEDLITYIGSIHCHDMNLNLSPKDKSVIFSISKQLDNLLPLTEKQAELIIKIFKNNRDRYNDIKNFENLIDNPKYKFPFRVLDDIRKIFLIDHEKRKYIAVKFSYNYKIIKLLSDLKLSNKINNNTHLFRLSEKNIVDIVDKFKNLNFEIEDQIISLYDQLKEIEREIEDHIISVKIENEDLKIINSNQNIDNYYFENKNDNLINNLVLAKIMGLYFSKGVNSKISKLDINSILKEILLSQKNHFYLSSIDFENIDKICNIIMNINPVIIILNISEKVDEKLKKWHETLSENGFKNEQISVLFRSNSNKKFNEYVKEFNLNNLVNESTKIVFIANKTPKILYKIDFQPKILISDSMYFTHFSNQRLIESHPLIIYYTDYIRSNLGSSIAKL